MGLETGFPGAFRTVSALAAPAQRASLIAAIFIVTYLAFSIPALIAGMATTDFGLHHTALVYRAAIATLGAAAAASLILRRLSPHPAGPPHAPIGP